MNPLYILRQYPRPDQVWPILGWNMVYILVQTGVLVWWRLHLSCDKNGDDQAVNCDDTGHDDGNKRLFSPYTVSIHFLS